MSLNNTEIRYYDSNVLRLPDDKRNEYHQQVDRLVTALNKRLQEQTEIKITKVVKAGSFAKYTILRKTSEDPVDVDVVFYISGRNVDKLKKAVDAALEGWETRVTTGNLNSFLGRVAAAHPHPVRSGKQPRILFGTQAQACPPTFVLFTSGKLDPQYERFVERRLREEFGFVGSPVNVEVRAREKRKR